MCINYLEIESTNVREGWRERERWRESEAALKDLYQNVKHIIVLFGKCLSWRRNRLR